MEVDAFGKVLPDKSVGVLIGPALPRREGIGKVNLDFGLLGKQFVLGHFSTAVLS